MDNSAIVTSTTRTIDFHSAKLTPVCFGKVVFYRLSGDIFMRPIETIATTGKHDYKTCKNCQKDWFKVLERAKAQFDRFPNCCQFHANLSKREWFDKSTMGNIPLQVANKYIFTKQHITNRANTTDWYNDITEYIDYTVDSFGGFPSDCGEPFFLSHYINDLIELFERNKTLPAEKINKILEYLRSYLKPEPKQVADLETLAQVYNKWLNTFPFSISYLANYKSHFENRLPIFTGPRKRNRYSDLERVSMQTQTGLVEELCNTTKQILDEIDTTELFENGLIPDTDKYELDLIKANHRVQQANLVRKFSKGELRYVEVLSKWLAREEEYFSKVARFYKNKPPTEYQQNVAYKTSDNLPKEDSHQLTLRQIALLHIYQNQQIKNHKADEIARQYGQQSGSKLIQHYNKLSNPLNRTNVDGREIKPMIGDIEAILPLLSPAQAKRPNDELLILKAKIL